MGSDRMLISYNFLGKISISKGLDNQVQFRIWVQVRVQQFLDLMISTTMSWKKFFQNEEKKTEGREKMTQLSINKVQRNGYEDTREEK